MPFFKHATIFETLSQEEGTIRQKTCCIRVSNSPGITASNPIPAATPLGGWWHLARSLSQNLQLTDPGQSNTLLKQINVFYQEKKNSGNSPRWLFALALNKQAQWSTAQEGLPREHPRNSQHGKARDALVQCCCWDSFQQTQPGVCNPASLPLFPSISLPP